MSNFDHRFTEKREPALPSPVAGQRPKIASAGVWYNAWSDEENKPPVHSIGST